MHGRLLPHLALARCTRHLRLCHLRWWRTHVDGTAIDLRLLFECSTNVTLYIPCGIRSTLDCTLAVQSSIARESHRVLQVLYCASDIAPIALAHARLVCSYLVVAVAADPSSSTGLAARPATLTHPDAALMIEEFIVRRERCSYTTHLRRLRSLHWHARSTVAVRLERRWRSAVHGVLLCNVLI